MGSFSKEDVYRPRSPRSLPGCRRVRRQACVRQSPQLLLRWLGHHHFRLRLRHNHNSRTHSRRNFADPDRASRHHVLQLHRVNNLNLRHFCLRYSSELRLRPLHRNRADLSITFTAQVAAAQAAAAQSSAQSLNAATLNTAIAAVIANLKVSDAATYGSLAVPTASAVAAPTITTTSSTSGVSTTAVSMFTVFTAAAVALARQ